MTLLCLCSGSRLLPGYYFLWQHLSWRGEQLWKDPDNWLFCILWTGSPYMSTEERAHGLARPHTSAAPQSSLCFSAAADIFSQTWQNDFRSSPAWFIASPLRFVKELDMCPSQSIPSLLWVSSQTDVSVSCSGCLFVGLCQRCSRCLCTRCYRWLQRRNIHCSAWNSISILIWDNMSAALAAVH